MIPSSTQLDKTASNTNVGPTKVNLSPGKACSGNLEVQQHKHVEAVSRVADKLAPLSREDRAEYDR